MDSSMYRRWTHRGSVTQELVFLSACTTQVLLWEPQLLSSTGVGVQEDSHLISKKLIAFTDTRICSGTSDPSWGYTWLSEGQQQSSFHSAFCEVHLGAGENGSHHFSVRTTSRARGHVFRILSICHTGKGDLVSLPQVLPGVCNTGHLLGNSMQPGAAESSWCPSQCTTGLHEMFWDHSQGLWKSGSGLCTWPLHFSPPLVSFWVLKGCDAAGRDHTMTQYSRLFSSAVDTTMACCLFFMFLCQHTSLLPASRPLTFAAADVQSWLWGTGSPLVRQTPSGRDDRVFVSTQTTQWEVCSATHPCVEATIFTRISPPLMTGRWEACVCSKQWRKFALPALCSCCFCWLPHPWSVAPVPCATLPWSQLL